MKVSGGTQSIDSWKTVFVIAYKLMLRYYWKTKLSFQTERVILDSV
jgi:hypothetical protein